MHNTNGFKKTTHRVITRRGVLWLGQTCNLRCRFCYFVNRVKAKDHPEHPFMALDKAKAICDTLVDTYGNNAIDIQGGEPTIYPWIHELVSHCRDIGLLPTLITNGLVLGKRENCEKLKDAGVRDFLVSVHGIGKTYEDIVCVPGASAKQMQALGHMADLDIPFRFNCVLAKSILPQLMDVARLADDTGCRVVNFIAFNPFEDQQENTRTLANVPSYTEVAEPLMRAMDFLEDAGIEVNVRYFPFCMVEEKYRKNLYNFQQLPYDLHEWDYGSWSWTQMNPQRMKGGDLDPVMTLRQANIHHSRMFKEREGYADDPAVTREEEYRDSARLRAREHCRYQFFPECGQCSIKNICDGFHGDYADLIGSHEAKAVRLKAPVDDPLHYCSGQEKIVEKEDHDWAL